MNWLVISPPRGTWRGGWIPPGRSPAAWPQTAPRGAGTPPCHCCCCPASPGSLAQAGTPARQCNGERMGNIGGAYYLHLAANGKPSENGSLSLRKLDRVWKILSLSVWVQKRNRCLFTGQILKLLTKKNCWAKGWQMPPATNTCSFSHLLNCLVISLNFF